MPGRTATVNPLTVCGAPNELSIASTIAGASLGVLAMFSTRCLNVQTPFRGSREVGSNTVRTGSSTTETLVIMSSWDVDTWHPGTRATVNGIDGTTTWVRGAGGGGGRTFGWVTRKSTLITS